MLTNPEALRGAALLFAQGLFITIELGILTVIFGGLLGGVLGATRASGPRWLQGPIAVYVEVMRSIPLLVFLFVAYYGLPIVLGINSLSPLTSAIIAMSLHNAAYTSQIVRAGLEAVPRGQWEAARALNLSYPGAMRHIILPQALRIIAPPFTLQSIGTFKDTSVASVIGLIDVTNNALVIRANTGSDWDVFAVLALLYFLICATVGAIGHALEKRFDRGYFLLERPSVPLDLMVPAAS
ncbi:MAG TPA: amino acid ABC transporter permease [Chloroflexota bacterium]|nr:amino acid ABC transporter permease [Chloroflexota bacterium]